MSIGADRVVGRPRGFWVGVGLKSTLAVLLALPLINPGWQQYEDKGMYWRLLVFPLAGLVVPLAWQLTGRRRPYPYLADGLVLVVPLTDVL